jgi:exodeoxyribonuclease VII large subunit
MDKRLLLLKSNLEYMINSLKLTNPLNVLQKGYSIVKKDNIIVKDKNSLRIGDNITINLHEGIINAKVTKIKEEK